jgi:hypothetical protein
MRDEPTEYAEVDSTDSVDWLSVKSETEAESAKLKVTALDPKESKTGSRAEAPIEIGSFSIREELGRGAFGTVYRAVNEAEDREVAIKIFAGRMTTKEAEVRFRREVEIASSLDHPNISSIIDYGTHKGLPFLVMRVIRGETIYQKVEREGSIPPGEAARIIRRLGIAIQHAHSRDVIHRDLKPSNVILERDEPVIVDLGLSKSLLTTESFTGKGDLLGSPLFMAPEQLFGEKADVRSDVFGLGGLLYYMLVAETPRTLEDFRKRATPDARLPREVPSGLASICAKALASKREKRFRTAAAMVSAVEDWIAGREPRIKPRRISMTIVLAMIAGLVFGSMLALQILNPGPEALDFDKNIVNSYEIGGTPVVFKDGRTTINRNSELCFPCLKVIVQDLETWSPPRQQLQASRRYFIGGFEGFILAYISFQPAPGHISGKVQFEKISVLSPPEAMLLQLVSKDGRFFTAEKEIAGALLKIDGRFEDKDDQGIIWSGKENDQLQSSLSGIPSWSPPKPMNRTDHTVEYPLGVVNDRFITARFLPPSEDGSIMLRIQIHSRKDATKP